ncbi:hypothetical protein CPB86DRAFT_800022 [Serendipita vermifera]|nr:hypothetical protein CPB86DRAFT_800022 [Serendipita vermifera]
MASSRTRSSAFAASQSAPSSSSIRDSTERRSSKGKRAKELTCETCGKHPVCLQKHRWEHNPLWRDTAQLLLSKHQQVQVMEAAAILVHGTSLPPDRALWPSYMSGGSLASPKLSGTGLPRIPGAASSSRHIGSPAATVSSFARDEPPSSQFDDDELEGVNQIEEDDEDGLEEEDEDDAKVDEEEEEEDEMTDESDIPLPSSTSQYAPTSANTVHGRSRSRSVGYHPYGSHGAGARVLPASLGATSYGWGVISESGKSAKAIGNKSSASDVHVSPKQSHVTPRSPMLIPNGNHMDSMYSHNHPRLHHHHSRSTSSGNYQPHGHHPYYHTPHQSISSFGSFTSSTSSYIPSSSLRSRDGMAEEVEEEAIMEGMDEEYDAHTRGYGFAHSRASDMYKRIVAVSSGSSGGAGSVNGMANGKSGMNAGATAAESSSSKSTSPERRRDEYMYDMELDME